MDESFFTEKEIRKASRGNAAPIIIVILVIVALAVLAFFGGKYYLSSKNSIKIFIDTSLNKLENNITDSGTTSGDLTININGDTTSKEGKIFKILNNLDLNINYGIDTKENITDVNIKTNYYSDELVDANIYIEDGNLYLYLNELYSKYIKYNYKKDNSNSNKISNEDYKIIVSSIRTALNESLKEEYFTKSWTKVNGKSVNKVELLLDDKNIKIINENIINNLKNNNKFISSFSRIINKEETEVKKLLDNEVKKINNNKYLDTKISLYTSITKFVMLEVSNKNVQTTINSNDNGFVYEIMDKENNNTYNGTFKIDIKDDNITYSNITKNDSSLVMNFSGTIKHNTKIEKKNVSNNILLEDITDKEYKEILSKIFNNKAFKRISEDISKNTNIKIGDVV